MSQIDKSTFQFLNKIKSNNNREWFQENKGEYENAHLNMISFAEAVLSEMNVHDQIETPSGKKCLHRIYRDVRFSKDKTPYKNNFSGSYRRATKFLRGGYYFHIQPGQSFVGGGFWGPNKEDLKLIRDQIMHDPTLIEEVISSKPFKSKFGELKGEQLKTAPKGIDKEHPSIELLRYKSFLVTHEFSDNEVLSKDFYLRLNESFKSMRPFFDAMSEMLTTNLNGEYLPGIK